MSRKREQSVELNSYRKLDAGRGATTSVEDLASFSEKERSVVLQRYTPETSLVSGDAHSLRNHSA